MIGGPLGMILAFAGRARQTSVRLVAATLHRTSSEPEREPDYGRGIMSIAPLRAAAASIAFAFALSAAASAASKPFSGINGWDHTIGATASAQAPRAQETWKKSDGQLVTYLSDAGLAYDDIVAMVKKNVADNGFKTTVDTDRKCDGRRAHEVEISFGTTLVRQIIVDDAPGATKLTYSRPQNSAASPDVMNAIAAYCGAAQ